MNLAPLPTATDETEIKAVIRRETDAFLNRDLEAWSACWLHSGLTTDVMVSSEIGVIAIRGWEAVHAHMKDVMERDLGCRKTWFTQDILQMTIEGDIAWLLFDGRSELPQSGIHETFETRILHRTGDGWRIAYSSFVHKRPPAASTTRVGVDIEGQILWIADETRARLKEHPGLIISGGRLRARKPAWNRALQDAFKRASKVSGFFEQFGYITNNGRSFRCPVVLGEDDDGGIVTCVVEVLDGLTYVDIGSQRELDERLVAAAAIFGLSPAQTDIAREIVAGHSMTAAARHLGITPATARTHLARIYDKTGVNAQPALVRILLSVG